MHSSRSSSRHTTASVLASCVILAACGSRSGAATSGGGGGDGVSMGATLDAPPRWLASPTLPALLLVTTAPATAQLDVQWSVPPECTIVSAGSTTDENGEAEASVTCPAGVKTVAGRAGEAQFTAAIEFYPWSWHEAMEGIPQGAAIAHLHQDPATLGRLYASTGIDSNRPEVYRSDDAAEHWLATPGDLALDEGIRALTVTSDGSVYVLSAAGAVRRSRDHGDTWEAASPVASASTIVEGAGGRLYAGTPDAAYASDDAAATWTVLGTWPEGWRGASVAPSPLDPDVAWAFLRQPPVHLTLLTSADGGQTWSATAPIEGWDSAWPAGDVFMLHPSSVDPGSAVAVVESSDSITAGHFYQSFVTHDLGQSWSLLTREQVTYVAERYPTVMYSAWERRGYDWSVDTGQVEPWVRYTMLRSDDAGGTWRDASGGATHVLFRNVLVDHANAQRVYAIVSGGVYASDTGGL